MSIQEQLKAFEKTDKFKKAVSDKMHTDSRFADTMAGHTSKFVAIDYGDAMKNFLRSEIQNIKSSVTKESFLDYIDVSETFVSGIGWVVDVSFNKEKMHRDSLFPQKYPNGVELNEIYNEGYSAKDYVYGTDRYKTKIRSRKSYPDESSRQQLYFVQKSVDKFNSKYKGKAVAQYNSKYKNGTL